MPNQFDWVVVSEAGHEAGAIGLIGDDAVAIASYSGDRANEPIGVSLDGGSKAER